MTLKKTVRVWLKNIIAEMRTHEVMCGHGFDIFDEALLILAYAMNVPVEKIDYFLDVPYLDFHEERKLRAVLKARIQERKPLSYITGQAYLGDYVFHVSESVVIPRSFLASFLMQDVIAWCSEVHAILELCTGSACLSIIAAHTFPEATIDAVDISPDALLVAHKNIQEYGLSHRIMLKEGDLYAPVDGQYDLIICNPPYVTQASFDMLPKEYLYEPSIGLVAGEDGLSVITPLLEQAPQYLTEQGVLIVEVGNNREYVEERYPHLEAHWFSPSLFDKDVYFLVTRDACLALK